MKDQKQQVEKFVKILKFRYIEGVKAGVASVSRQGVQYNSQATLIRYFTTYDRYVLCIIV